MIENIKNMWALMLKDTKKQAVKAILEQVDNVSDEIYVKQTWIWGGRIPEESQPKVVEIFQNALKSQNEKVNSSIEA